MVETNKIIHGDALQILKTLPSESVNCVMTSPPYWALRDYGVDVETIWDAKEGCEHDFEIKERYVHRGSANNTVHGAINSGGLEVNWKTKDSFCSKCGAWKGQLGLEPTFDLYIKHLCDIFDEVKRVLRKDGTCWVNLGDTYSGSNRGYGADNITNYAKSKVQLANVGSFVPPPKWDLMNLQDKNLCLIPFRFAIEMQNRGWILRNVLIWHKPSCMPSSVKDRFTIDFEYIFFFVKNKKYWFETQYEPSTYEDRDKRRKYGYKGKIVGDGYRNELPNRNVEEFALKNLPDFRNKRAVWTITTKPFKESHFAVYPEELCETPIRAGCPEFVCNKCGKAREKIIETDGKCNEGEYNPNRPDGMILRGNSFNPIRKFKGYSDCGCDAGFSGGIVLDPFIGSGTTGLVALKQNKQFIGIELNQKYIKIAMRRLKPYLEQRKLNEVENGE